MRGGLFPALVATAALMLGGAAHAAPSAADYAADARALDAIIVENYAYLDRFGGVLPVSARLDAEREAVSDNDSLLHYAEDRIASIADHHAITGRSFKDSWGLVPSYADLWIVADKDGYRIDAVRAGTPAASVNVVPGARLISVNGVPIDKAVADYWAALGYEGVTDPERRAYAARVLAAGRRNAVRNFSVREGKRTRQLSIATLYMSSAGDRPPVSVIPGASGTTIRFNDSLGRDDTVAAFDAAMAGIPAGTALTIDLTDTGSGGDSSVARGVMGWFIDKPHFYQMHRLMAEERTSGIVRQWVEQVHPRPGKHFAGPVSVHVGRWTGSMGEGMAIGFTAIGLPVCGGGMAGLRGAVYDFTLPASGLVVKLPAERVFTPEGAPREDVIPPACV